MIPIHPQGSLAVIGMDANWGGSVGLAAFELATYNADNRISSFSAVPQGNPIPRIQEAQQSLEKSSFTALSDAGIFVGLGQKLRIALVVAANSGIKNDWEWPYELLDLSFHPNPLVEAIEYAVYKLSQEEADVVVFAAANLFSPEEKDRLIIETQDEKQRTLGFDRSIHSYLHGEGVGAAVFMLSARARNEGRRIYANIRGSASKGTKNTAIKQNTGSVDLIHAPTVEDVRKCCQEALAKAGVLPEHVGYIEAFACGLDALDGIEIAGLVQAYRRDPQNFTTALGSVQSSAGFLGPAAGLAGLVQVALCLYQRFFPGVPGWTGPKLPALWRGAPFYVPLDSRPWFAPEDNTKRLAGLNLMGNFGAVAHLILEEPVEMGYRPNQALSLGGFYLLPVVGDDLPDLENRLSELKTDLKETDPLGKLAAKWYQKALSSNQTRFALAVVGHSKEEMLRELELAAKSLPAVLERESDWQTPLGSYFTAMPVGSLGDVAMVYPGAFNSYPGVGKDLLYLFPSLHLRVNELTANLGNVLRERMLFPRSLYPPTKEVLVEQESALLSDPIAMLITGTALAVMYTHILQDTFGVRPAAAFGYSLGENSMIYATGVWFSQGDEAASRLESSDVFKVRLAGPQQAVREYWGWQDAQIPLEESLWSNYLVMADPEKVKEAIQKEPRVYLTHINTPRQVVIGGDPHACQRVLAELNCPSLKAPFDYALHCAPMRSEYQALAELHSYPVENDTNLRLYSAAEYRPLQLDQQSIADRMAQMLTSPLDFPRLVRKVYEDGARIFIEAGAGSNCARWIDETLKGEPHLALSMNRRGTDDYHTLIRMVARLYSHRVPICLSALYQAFTGNQEL